MKPYKKINLHLRTKGNFVMKTIRCDLYTKKLKYCLQMDFVLKERRCIEF